MQTLSGGRGAGGGIPALSCTTEPQPGAFRLDRLQPPPTSSVCGLPAFPPPVVPGSLQPAGVSSLLPLLPLSPHGGGAPRLGNSQCSWADKRLTTGTPFLPSLSSTTLPPWKERGRDCTPAECVREWMCVCPYVGWVKVPESKGSAGSVGAAYSHPKGQQPSWCPSHPAPSRSPTFTLGQKHMRN